MGRTAHQLRARNVKNGSLRLDRHSGSGRLGAPKKGGAGAKYIWGVAGNQDDSSFIFVDNMDPNYSEDEEGFYMPHRVASFLVKGDLCLLRETQPTDAGFLAVMVVGSNKSAGRISRIGSSNMSFPGHSPRFGQG